MRPIFGHQVLSKCIPKQFINNRASFHSKIIFNQNILSYKNNKCMIPSNNNFNKRTFSTQHHSSSGSKHGTGHTPHDHHTHQKHHKHPDTVIISSNPPHKIKTPQTPPNSLSVKIVSTCIALSALGGLGYYFIPLAEHWKSEHFYVPPNATKFNHRLHQILSPISALYWNDQSLLFQRLILNSKDLITLYDQGNKDIVYQKYLQFICKEAKTSIIDIHHTIERCEQNKSKIINLRDILQNTLNVLHFNPDLSNGGQIQHLRQELSQDLYFIEKYFLPFNGQAINALSRVNDITYQTVTMLAEGQNMTQIGQDYVLKIQYLPILKSYNQLRHVSSINLTQLSRLSLVIPQYIELLNKVQKDQSLTTIHEVIKGYDELFAKTQFRSLVELINVENAAKSSIDNVVYETNKLLPYFASQSLKPHSIPLPILTLGDVDDPDHTKVPKLPFDILPQEFSHVQTLSNEEIARSYIPEITSVSEQRIEVVGTSIKIK